MIGLVLATVFAAHKPVPPQAQPTAAKNAPPIVQKVDKEDASRSLERLFDGVPVAAQVPLVFKPTFAPGPAASLSLKF